MVSVTDVRLAVAAATDTGHKRAVNEDSLLADRPVFIVADGMGGHEAGDLASAAIVDSFSQLVAVDAASVDDVARVITEAHDAVRLIADDTTRGAGSTLAGVVLVEHDGVALWLVINIGDSRVYRAAGGRLEQLTVDHSIVQQLVADGTLRPEDAATYVSRNIITRAVGSPDSPPDFWLHPVITGERLLVCSDGLTGELDDESIRAALTGVGSPQEIADALLADALARGGRDNVSLVIVEVIEGGDASTASIGLDGDAEDTVPRVR